MRARHLIVDFSDDHWGVAGGVQRAIDGRAQADEAVPSGGETCIRTTSRGIPPFSNRASISLRKMGV